jgi:NAD(P)-dependent dehydrogenase (short-subunit alcohol dehydrogenase family)
MATSIVIGGTRGMGSVIADHLSDRGDMVYTVSRSSSKRENHIKCDISFDCASIIDNIDSIDYLVFSHRYRGSDWNEMFDVNVKSVRNLIELTVSKFKNGGSVVVISSNASQFILEEQPAEYHASRAALDALMRYYAVAYGKKGIRFNSILPSTLIKPENVDFFTKDNKVRKMIENITPLNRMGSADDIANIVDFLCSQKSSFLTGNSFMADGGLSLIGQETIARNLLDCNHEK